MNSILDSARLAFVAIRAFGFRWVLFRLQYRLMLRFGLMERHSVAREWFTVPLAHWLTNSSLAEPKAYLDFRRSKAPVFFVAARDRAQYAPLLAAFDKAGGDAVAAADRLINGMWTWFGAINVQAGTPPDWHRNPLTGLRAPTDIHWSRLPDFAFGDIKMIWEPSRFGAAYLLVRAAWRTGDDRYAEQFWRLVEDWREHNPPDLGVNWKCGQETSIRVMAWIFGLYALIESPASTPIRVAMLGAMIAQSGARVEANLEYALSQFNNHGVSEGVGLFTIGTLFPEFQSAARWKNMGRKVLESLSRSLIYDDGAFSQHSVNYHRLMLHDYLWSIRIAELNGEPLSAELQARVRLAAELLEGFQDTTTGQLPVYGANDGSLIVPLSNCAPDDYRPVLQAARAILHYNRAYAEGRWDEEALWFAGPAALNAPLRPLTQRALWADAGGYYTLRSGTGFAFVRCATFRHRPGHADELHVDLWMDGVNVALDPGTYGYNADVPWAKDFECTASHNTVTVDGLNQTSKVSRFLSYPWPQGRVRSTPADAGATPVAYWEGEHSAYSRLSNPASHRRAVIALNNAAWIVIDGLSSTAAHKYRLHWLIADAKHKWNDNTGALELQLSSQMYYLRIGTAAEGAKASLIRAEKDGARGWRAPGYGQRTPALSVALEVRATATWCWSVFTTSPVEVTCAGNELTLISDKWRADVVVDVSGIGSLARATWNPISVSPVEIVSGKRE